MYKLSVNLYLYIISDAKLLVAVTFIFVVVISSAVMYAYLHNIYQCQKWGLYERILNFNVNPD